MRSSTSPSLPRLVFLLVAWAALAAAFAASGLATRGPAGAVPTLVFGLTIVSIVCVRRIPWLRATVDSLPTKTLVVPHVTRFVGVVFLILHAAGRLPAAFANNAGWGDIVTAAGAIGILTLPYGPRFTHALWVWNTFGALDLFVAVGTATWLNAENPGSMSEMVRLPLAFVPLCLVPWMLTTHAILLRRLRQGTLAPSATPAPA